MKTSVALSVFPAPEGMPALFSQATEENLTLIRRCGYDGVDLFVRAPFSEETLQAVRRLERAGLGIGVIMPAALAREGLFLTHPDPVVRRETIARMGEIIRLAHQTGGMVSLGLVRGSRAQHRGEAAFLADFAHACEELLELAAPLDVPLVIEPINRYEINNINSVVQGVAFLRETKLPLFLMIDLFHMNIEERSIEDALELSLPYTKHIHFLDSNRLAPSMGHMDMAGFYHLIRDTGYDGYLCLEALPLPDARICAETGAAFFRTVSLSKGKGE